MQAALKQPRIAHLIAEIIILIMLVLWVSSKYKRMNSHMENLLQRIEEQEERIQKLEQSLIDVQLGMKKFHQRPIPSHQPVPVPTHSKPAQPAQQAQPPTPHPAHPAQPTQPAQPPVSKKPVTVTVIEVEPEPEVRLSKELELDEELKEELEELGVDVESGEEIDTDTLPHAPRRTFLL